MNWKIYITDRAKKQIRKLPERYAERIKNTVDTIEINPFIGDIEKLSGEENVWRRRVGPYRIFYEICSARKIIYIFEVKRRTSSTY
ncbi:type II toxin-antitoxin system RelE/ParE family toxin [Patescibacteria group bacterium]|nr:type II toxin-antitoxin system RelE/ParE family toxin [Patescibacteria group bacterium]